MMAPLDELLREFAETELARACAVPDGAYANCLAVSATCVVWLRAGGLPCGLIKLSGSRRAFPGATGRWPYCDPAGFTHWTISVGGQSVDWSVRQFDPAAAWPQVVPVAELAGRWHRVEVWACESCERLVTDPRHIETAPPDLVAVHRLRARESAGRGPFPDPRHSHDVGPLDPLCACARPAPDADPQADLAPA